MRENKALEELKRVQTTYNNIATEFHHSRKKMMKDLEYITKYLSKHQKIADIGCGNGRLLSFIKSKVHQFNYKGIDNSSEMIRIAKEQNPNAQFIEGDFLNLPLENDSQDLIISIRAYHHLTSKKLRLHALQEIKRVLKNNGKAIISVWNLWHKKNWRILCQAVFRSILTLGKYSPKDTFVAWGKNNQRYYHAFTSYELQKLADDAGFRVIEIFGASKGKKVSIRKSDDVVMIVQKH